MPRDSNCAVFVEQKKVQIRKAFWHKVANCYVRSTKWKLIFFVSGQKGAWGRNIVYLKCFFSTLQSFPIARSGILNQRFGQTLQLFIIISKFKLVVKSDEIGVAGMVYWRCWWSGWWSGVVIFVGGVRGRRRTGSQSYVSPLPTLPMHWRFNYLTPQILFPGFTIPCNCRSLKTPFPLFPFLVAFDFSWQEIR